MLSQLPESAPLRRRGGSITIVSVAAHAALIVAAVHATASARPAPRLRPDSGPEIIYRQPVPVSATPVPSLPHAAPSPTLPTAPSVRVALPTVNFADLPNTRFVIDTTGRVERGSLVVERSDHALFTSAVRAALPSHRFLPAESGGRKVRVLAQQAFEFRIER
ncbi:MAG: energy transducer TonB [Gemmatimonadaceae bacterium]